MELKWIGDFIHMLVVHCMTERTNSAASSSQLHLEQKPSTLSLVTHNHKAKPHPLNHFRNTPPPPPTLPPHATHLTSLSHFTVSTSLLPSFLPSPPFKSTHPLLDRLEMSSEPIQIDSTVISSLRKQREELMSKRNETLVFSPESPLIP